AQVVVSPAAVTAGGRARVSVFGFSNGSRLRVSLSGQPDFTVNTVNGSYSWDLLPPLSSRSGSISIHALDAGSNTTADGALTVRGLVDNRIPVTKIQGDNQTGLPGAMLPLSLRVALRDAGGNPVSGAPIVFQASLGAALSLSQAVSDANGLAET